MRHFDAGPPAPSLPLPRRALKPSPAAHASSAPDALRALREIAGAIAGGEALADVVPVLLETLSRTLGGDECVVWLTAEPSGELQRAWFLGDPRTSARDVGAVLAGRATPHSGMLAARLQAGQRSLGAITLRLAAPPAEEDELFFATAANMLAPVLAQAEHARRLEHEVRARTAEIETQRRFFAKMVDSLPMGLYVIDREFRIQAWNRKREIGMQGVSREEAIGRTIFEILHRQPAELLRREFEDVFRTGRVQQFQVESDASGELRTFRITKIPMHLEDGEVTHVITIGEDMTDWREAQERFAQAEKLAALGTLAAGVMHEINNPLATIAACAEAAGLSIDHEAFARAGAAPQATAMRDALALIEQEVQRCKGIVDTVLDFSRPKPAKMALVDPNEVIDRTLFILKHHTRFKKLTVVVEADRTIGRTLLGNEEQLVQVVMALLLNAMDAMRDRGTVLLRTRADESGVAIEVQDHGEGIQRTDMKKIFEPFFTTKPPGRGTGLGLSICYNIIAEHGGRMEVESTPGVGSTFRILLPRPSDAALARALGAGVPA